MKINDAMNIERIKTLVCRIEQERAAVAANNMCDITHALVYADATSEEIDDLLNMPFKDVLDMFSILNIEIQAEYKSGGKESEDTLLELMCNMLDIPGQTTKQVDKTT
jgi:hypothetical protein